MTCKSCNSRNPIGNKFCRECGAKLAAPEGALATEEIARAEAERRAERAAVLLADAHLLAEQGKYLAAIPVAEEAARDAPFSTSAHSLLATLYEHTGQKEKAVAAQERVVSLNPDSSADITRLERLRRGEITTAPPALAAAVPTLKNGGSAAPTSTAVPNWVPLAASVGGGLVVFLGFLALSPRPAPRAPGSAANPVAVISPAPRATVNNPLAAAPPAPDPARGGDPFVPLGEERRALQAAARKRDAPPAPNAAPLPTIAAGLPAIKRLGDSAPKPPPAPVVVAIQKDAAPGGNDRADTTPLAPITAAPPDTARGAAAGTRPASPSSEDSPAAAPRRVSYMRITVGKASAQPTTAQPAARVAPILATPPKTTVDAPDMEGDPLRRARSLEKLRRYKEAVGAYREAIAAGSPAGDAQQAIGWCYQQSGDIASAKTAYQQAISAYEANIVSGHGVSAAERGINSCKAAIGVLGE